MEPLKFTSKIIEERKCRKCGRIFKPFLMKQWLCSICGCENLFTVVFGEDRSKWPDISKIKP